MARTLTTAEKKRYAAMTSQATKQLAAITGGTYKPPAATSPAATPQMNKNSTINKPVVNAPPAAPKIAAPAAPTPKRTTGSNSRTGVSVNQNVTRADGSAVAPGFDPIGSGIKKLDAATGIVSKITGSKAFNTAKYAGAKAFTGAGEAIGKLNEGYKASAGSPMRVQQNSQADAYKNAAKGIDSQKANATAAKVTNKYVTQPYLKSGVGKTLGNTTGATKGLVDLTTPVYSADALARGKGGALEAADFAASAIPGVGLFAGMAVKTLRKAEDFVKLYDKSIDLMELGKKSAKAVDAIKNAPTVKPTTVRVKTTMSPAVLESELAGGAKIFKDPAGGLLIQSPGGKAMKLDISEVKKHDDASVKKQTTKEEKFEAPPEEKIDTRSFQPGTFKGSADDIKNGSKTVHAVKGEKQINMSPEQLKMLSDERTAARKAAGIPKTGTPESAEFNKAFDAKWYAQKGLQPNGGKANTGDYQVTMADGSTHLVNEKDFPGLDLAAIGKGKAGTAGKSANSRAKAPAGGPKLVNHILENAKAGGKTSTTVKNALTKAVADKKISQKEMDDAMFQFKDATMPQGPVAPTGKLSKAVSAEAAKAKSFYFNKNNDVTFVRVDGSKSPIVKAKDMTPEDIVLLKERLAVKAPATPKAPSNKAKAEAGTVTGKGTYMPTEADKAAATAAAKEARVGKTFATPEEKTAWNNAFYNDFYAKIGETAPKAPPKEKAAPASKAAEYLKGEDISGNTTLSTESAPDADLIRYMDKTIDDMEYKLANGSDGGTDIVDAVTEDFYDAWSTESLKADRSGIPGAAEEVDKAFDRLADYMYDRLEAKGWLSRNGANPTAAERASYEAKEAGPGVAPAPKKASTTAPTPPTSQAVKDIPTPVGKVGVQGKKNSPLQKRPANVSPEEWSDLAKKDAMSGIKVENARAGGQKQSGWRVIAKDGTKTEYAKADLTSEANNILESLRAETAKVPRDGTAAPVSPAKDYLSGKDVAGPDALAKSDAVPESITPVEAPLEVDTAAPASTVGPKVVDDVVTQVADIKKTAALRAATPAPEQLDGQIPMSLDGTAEGLGDSTPIDGEQMTMDLGAMQAEPQMAQAAAPTPGGTPQGAGGQQSKVTVGGTSAGGGGKAPMSWGTKAKIGAGVLAAGAAGTIALGGFGSSPAPEAETGQASGSVADAYNGTGGMSDTGAIGGGVQPTGGAQPTMGTMPQTPMPTQPQPAAQQGGQPGTPTDWYYMNENGELEGPYEGVIGPDNLTYYQDENGQWQRVPDGAVVDAPNGTDYQRGAGLDDSDPTNDNIYNADSPYIPKLAEVIDPELEQIIEANGGYTVENLMEVYAPYLESQNAEIDSQVEADITALREQLAARGMYNSDIALTQEQQIRSAGEAKKQGLYQQMLQQAQETAMEYEYKYAQLGEEQKMNAYEMESGDREFQQAVKEFESQTGIAWAKIDQATQKELYDRFNDDRKYNLSASKAAASGGGGGATPATLVKIQQEMLDFMRGYTANPAQYAGIKDPYQYAASKLKSYVSLGQLSESQASQIANNLDTL